MSKLIDAKIYKIKHEFLDLQYIGSTTTSLKTRWSNHKQNYTQHLNNKTPRLKCILYSIFDKYNIASFKISLIKDVKVCDQKHLFAIEQLYINKLKCCNKNNAFQPLPKKILSKLHYEKNKDRYNELFYCDCGGYYTLKNKEKHLKTGIHIGYLLSFT